jgi:hypothetical protein
MVGKLVALCAAQLSARCLRAAPPGGDEQGAADRWEGTWEMLDLVAEDPVGDAAERLQLAASRFMLRHVEALVEQARFVDNRAEIAEQLLEHAYPAFLRISEEVALTAARNSPAEWFPTPFAVPPFAACINTHLVYLWKYEPGTWEHGA